MFIEPENQSENKTALYELMNTQLKALTADERHCIPNLANAAALLWMTLPAINWAGFYLVTNGILLLGPFQGKPACIRIPMGKGVCGTAAKENRTVRVEDVHQFPGHIACDCASNAEIVIPLHSGGTVIGVMDIDSPILSRFTSEDQKYLEIFAGILENACDWEEK